MLRKADLSAAGVTGPVGTGVPFRTVGGQRESFRHLHHLGRCLPSLL